MSGFEIYTKKEKFAWGIACMDIGVTIFALTAIFSALFSVFTMPYNFSYIYMLQLFAIPLAVLVVWGRTYKLPRWGFVLLAGVASFWWLKVNVYQGVLSSVNSAIKLINRCYNIDLSLLPTWQQVSGAATSSASNEKLSFLWILCVLELLVGMLLLKVLKCARGRFCAIFIFLLPVILGIFCGKLPDVTSGCFLIVAIFLFLTASYHREKRLPMRAFVSAMILLFVVWLGARPIESCIFAYKEAHLKEYKEIKTKLITSRKIDFANWIWESFDGVKDKVEEIFPELQMGVDWNKNLRKLDKLVRNGEVLDEIVLSSKPTEDIYWPVFVGYVYTGEDWAPKGSESGVYEHLTKVKALWPMKEYYEVDRIYEILKDYFYSNHFKYTTNPKKMLEDMDFVEGFMFETKEGYCVHFATAATVFYQMSEKEARYVEGYMVSPNYFEKQSDGTYKAIITDYMAHAWCETYDAETNSWQVREHTLASGLPNYRPPTTPTPTTTPTQMPTTAPTQEPTAEPSKTPTQNQQQEKPTVTPVGKDENGEEFLGGNTPDEGSVLLLVWKTIQKVCLYVLGAMFVISILFLVLLLQRRLRVKRKELRFRNKYVKKAILALYRAIQDLCCFAGVKDNQIWRQEHMLQIAEQFPQLSQAEWQWLYDCVQRTMFSNDVISLTEQKQMYHLYQQLRTGILEQLSVRRRIWFLYGKAF